MTLENEEFKSSALVWQFQMSKVGAEMAKFDPLPETPEWTDWKNIWHDWLRHRPNYLAKFGFEKIFADGGTHTQHFVLFFLLFLKLFTLFDEGAAKTAEPILTRSMSIDAVWWEPDPFLEKKNIGQWPWPWKGQNVPFCLILKILTRIFSKTVRDREKMSIEVRYFWPQVTSKGQGQTLKTL